MNKEEIYRETSYRRILLRVKMGFEKFRKDRKTTLLFLLGIAVLLIVWCLRDTVFGLNRADMLYGMLHFLTSFAVLVVGALVAVITLCLLGTPRDAWSVERDLTRAGVVNHSGEPPLLVSIRTENGKTIMEFDSYGIPVSAFIERQAEIESALNCFVSKLAEGHDNRRIIIHTVDATNRLSTMLEWNDGFLVPSSESSPMPVVVGESVSGAYTIDLAKNPHMLIGGSTGSGKSILMKNICWQCFWHDAKVIIADLKGGVDYPRAWKRHMKIATTEEAVADLLSKLVKELHRRMNILDEADIENVYSYNLTAERPIAPIVFACDEVAELLDCSGLSKEEKQRIEEITGHLATIARMGRAAAIHLVLATQRPDANILPGQIKNNIMFRVCGRADKILSRIILDNDDAADKIMADAQGRFLTKDGVLIQAYWFDAKEAANRYAALRNIPKEPD